MPVLQTGAGYRLRPGFRGHLHAPFLQLTMKMAKLVSYAPPLGNWAMGSSSSAARRWQPAIRRSPLKI